MFNVVFVLALYLDGECCTILAITSDGKLQSDVNAMKRLGKFSKLRNKNGSIILQNGIPVYINLNGHSTLNFTENNEWVVS